jgi:hypothetical protein
LGQRCVAEENPDGEEGDSEEVGEEDERLFDEASE